MNVHEGLRYNEGCYHAVSAKHGFNRQCQNVFVQDQGHNGIYTQGVYKCSKSQNVHLCNVFLSLNIWELRILSSFSLEPPLSFTHQPILFEFNTHGWSRFRNGLIKRIAQEAISGFEIVLELQSSSHCMWSS